MMRWSQNFPSAFSRGFQTRKRQIRHVFWKSWKKISDQSDKEIRAKFCSCTTWLQMLATGLFSSKKRGADAWLTGDRAATAHRQQQLLKKGGNIPDKCRGFFLKKLSRQRWNQKPAMKGSPVLLTPQRQQCRASAKEVVPKNDWTCLVKLFPFKKKIAFF